MNDFFDWPFSFGSYPQGKNGEREPIEWIILAKENGKALVISKYALDALPYNTERTDVTWENCSLRKWMNDTFLNNAFSAEEQAKIATTNVSADKNRLYGTNSGNSTNDKVFLLSTTEAEKYFPTYELGKGIPTAYARSKGPVLTAIDGVIVTPWWLRTNGISQRFATRVHWKAYDAVEYTGAPVYSRHDYCIRPAMWINIY